MMIDFFGTLPGLLSLAGLGLLLILVSILKRLAARARARRAGARSGSAAAPAGTAALPRWAVAAIAAWAAADEEAARGTPALTSSGFATPSAEAWKPTAGVQDPWLAAGGPGRRNLGVYK